MVGSHLAMPILVLNMGGEMIYILHQRLQAQNIPEEKARKVLEDVIRTMYTPLFLEELFKPQEMYTNASTKQIFDKLAHSSIMRLNKTSMEKLYDLMTMGVKYQLLSCTCSQQYLQVTLQHLDALGEIVQSDQVQPLLQSAVSRCIRIYTQLSQANWLLLQQTVLQFFQGRRVKVSLFLQHNLQSVTGVLTLKNDGKLPFNTELPGQIRYYENGRVINTNYFQSVITEQVSVSKEVLDFASSLGRNMYVKPPEDGRTTPKGASVSFREAENAFARAMSSLLTAASAKSPPLSPDAKYAGGAQAKSFGQSSAKAELSLLSELLGVSSTKTAGSKDEKGLRLNFGTVTNRDFASKEDDDADVASSKETADSKDGTEALFITIDIDASVGAKTVEGYMRDLDLKDDYDTRKAERKGAAEDDDDDLLALMDSAK